MENQAIEPADFISDFEEIDQHVRQWYELAQQKNISLSELYQTYRKQVSQAPYSTFCLPYLKGY